MAVMVQGPHMIVFREQLKLQIFIFHILRTRLKNSLSAGGCWERLFIPTRPFGKMQLGHIGTDRYSFVLMIEEWATRLGPGRTKIFSIASKPLQLLSVNAARCKNCKRFTGNS